MKFARYLEDNCTPEWKRAYIDYRKLKKCIKAIQQRQLSGEAPGKITEADIPDSDEHQQDEGRGSISSHERSLRDSDVEGRDPIRNGIQPGRTVSACEGRTSIDVDNDDVDDDDDDDDDDDEDTGPYAFPPPKKTIKSEDLAKGESPKSRWLQNRKAELEGKLASPRLSIPASSPAESQSGIRPGYGSMGRTPPMNRHRAPSPPVLILPEPSNPETNTSNEKEDGSPQTEQTHNTESGSTHSATPLATKGKKHLHWNSSRTDGDDVTRDADDEGEGRAASGSQSASGSGRDSSSGDEDRHMPAPKAFKSPRLLGMSPSLSNKSPKIFGGKGNENAVGLTRNDSNRRTLSSAGGMAPRYPETIQVLYKICYADERRFFTVLDGELEKVEAFYHDRESDAIRRSHQLKAQLRELAEHRRIFHEAEVERNKNGVRKYLSTPKQIAQEMQKRVPFGSTVNLDVNNNNKVHEDPDMNGGGGSQGSDFAKQRNNSQEEADSEREQILKEFDPEKYQRYKKKLKLAVMEHYKELEILKNYRILNLTGFKKALKKFEKTAKVGRLRQRA
ncbi:hypothetical protein QFC19_007457 [Naganishia cerealis]|uniref:Uncharacterized protein n=1 Tax=Naganishia cerealis TaxID=610337 RepID=A0ACC2V9U4_9TREE|nr:hypothetical protein QFC19_007457 [Naganishia cerealis]